MGNMINLFARPWFRRLACLTLTVAQAPGTLWLLWSGHTVQALGATVAGLLLGRHLCPALHRADRQFLVVLTSYAIELATADDHLRQLLDQCLVPLMVVVLWPDAPTQWLKSRLDRVLQIRRAWSSGVPVHPSSGVLVRSGPE